jgi:hypothetical protein
MFDRCPAAASVASGMLLLVLVAQASVMAKGKPRNRSEGAGIQSAGAPLTLSVTPRLAWIGSAVKALVRVSPDDRNRLLRITVDSSDYYRSSDVALDGAEARRSHLLFLSSLPAGSYAIEAVVYGPSGERGRIQQKFEVLSGQDDDQQLTSAKPPRRGVYPRH